MYDFIYYSVVRGKLEINKSYVNEVVQNIKRVRMKEFGDRHHSKLLLMNHLRDVKYCYFPEK